MYSERIWYCKESGKGEDAYKWAAKYDVEKEEEEQKMGEKREEERRREKNRSKRSVATEKGEEI